jgi:glycosyltransferase involved in cell wall biosynthesis
VNRPGVSVVVPTHDRPALLERAVRSVVEQTYDGEIEVVVVADGGPAVDPQVALPSGRQLRTLANDRTRGPSGARNTGLLAATHDLVAFLDDDDRWRPDKLDRQLATFAGHPDVPLCGTAVAVEDGRSSSPCLVPHDLVTHEHLLRNRLAGLHTSGFLLRRAAFIERVGLFDEQLPRSYCEDYDLLLRAAQLGPIPVANEPLVLVTRQGQSHFIGRWDAYGDALELLLAKHPAFTTVRAASGRIEGQIAFARAAQGRRGDALGWIRRSLGHDPRQPKAWLALLVALRLGSAGWVTRSAARFGKGI